MKPPPWLNDPSALVLVDWSWLTNRAMHGQHGLDGMLALLVGWLTQILAHEPAALALCLDSPGETWRHAKRHPIDPEWRYKADRPPKPPEFTSISGVATKIAELHAIPCLWADGFEADDIIATATARARAAGYRVWIATADKDLHHLVEDDARSGLIVGTWSPFDSDTWHWRGPSHVREVYGVEPEQIPDWLAIAGDTSDGVPGVGNGLGPTRAAAILKAYPTLAEALAAPVWSSTKVEEIEAEIKALAKALKSKAPQKVEEIECAKVRREALMEAKRVEGWRLTLVAHRPLAEFSRELTALDCDALDDLPWEDLPVGGFDVEALRTLYTRHGFTRKAAEVPSVRKRAPWRLPWVADDGAPAPRMAGGRPGDGEPGGKAPAGRGERGSGGPVRGTGEGHEGPADRGGAVLRGQLPAVAPGTCSYSKCVGTPAHDEARRIVAGIVTSADAVRAIFAIRALGMLEAPTVEHVAYASARYAALEGRAA